MGQIDERVNDVAYVKYDRCGKHNMELLRVMNMSAELAGAIGRELTEAPRINASLSHKQAVALLNIDALSARSGVTLDGNALRNAFNNEGFRFDQDGPCGLVSDRVKQDLREDALDAAVECGFTPYLDFFGEDVVENSSPDVARMDSDVISDDDLDRLLAHLCAASTE
jgi:hypothetical protein